MFCNCGEMHWSYVHLLCTCLLVFLHLFLGGAMTRVVATTYCPSVCASYKVFDSRHHYMPLILYVPKVLRWVSGLLP